MFQSAFGPYPRSEWVPDFTYGWHGCEPVQRDGVWERSQYRVKAGEALLDRFKNPEKRVSVVPSRRTFMPTPRNSWRRALTAVAAVLLATTGLAALAASSADAAVSCSATYAKSWDNGSGFGATLSVVNTGDPLTSWS